VKPPCPLPRWTGAQHSACRQASSKGATTKDGRGPAWYKGGNRPIAPSEAFRLFAAGPAARPGRQLKSLWKGVRGTTFLQKDFPRELIQGSFKKPYSVGAPCSNTLVMWVAHHDKERRLGAESGPVSDSGEYALAQASLHAAPRELVLSDHPGHLVVPEREVHNQETRWVLHAPNCTPRIGRPQVSGSSH